jgi:hypothetical protein
MVHKHLCNFKSIMDTLHLFLEAELLYSQNPIFLHSNTLQEQCFQNTHIISPMSIGSIIIVYDHKMVALDVKMLYILVTLIKKVTEN